VKAAALALVLVAAGCNSSITEVVLFIEAPNLQVPRDLDALSLVVTDRDLPDGSPVELAQPVSPLCPTGAPASSCFSFPLSVTLEPGPNRPHDLVRVELQALLDAKVVIDDAASFNFSDGARRRLDFVLEPACLGTLCGDNGAGASCVSGGACGTLATTALVDPPDLQN